MLLKYVRYPRMQRFDAILRLSGRLEAEYPQGWGRHPQIHLQI